MNNLSVLCVSYNQKYDDYSMQMDTSLFCPSCGRKIYSVNYEATLSILKKKRWQLCKECNFERNIEDFKISLLCISVSSKQFLIQNMFKK